MSDGPQSRDLALPDETDVAAPTLATASPPASLARQIGLRGGVALAGAGYVVVAGLMIIGLIVRVATNGHLGSSIPGLILCSGSVIGGVSMVRWAVRLGHRPTDGARRQLGGAPPSAVPVQELLLAVAMGHGGRVTAAEVAAAMAIAPTHALRMLDEATQVGEARVLFSPEGIAVFEFPGLLASKADAKEPWQL